MHEQSRHDSPTLCGRSLTKNYGEGESEVQALDNVSLDLFAGELTLLKGPSGSGKTTLLAVLSGLLHPTAGRATVLGQDLWAMSERQREDFRLKHCGFVFQEANLLPALTAQQQLEMILRWGVGTSAREARARTETMLVALGLAGKGHLRSAQLSGGEKQRVAVGRALIKSPSFCFADEPTSALDWSRGELVIKLLHDAARFQNCTVLVVSHDVRVAEYADRVLFIEDGRLSGRQNADRQAVKDRLGETPASMYRTEDTEGDRR